METKDLTKNVDAVIEQMDGIVIEDENSASEAGEFLKKVKQTQKIVEDFFRDDIKAAHEAHKKLTGERKFYLDKLKAAETTVKKKVASYKMEAERKRIEEQRRLTEEARRKAEEMMIDKAIETGDESYLERSTDAIKVEAPPVQKIDGVSFPDNWTFEITNEKEIPIEFMTPDLKKIGAYVKMHKGKYPVPGCRIWNDKQVRVST